jgi:hypothetical protein
MAACPIMLIEKATSAKSRIKPPPSIRYAPCVLIVTLWKLVVCICALPHIAPENPVARLCAGVAVSPVYGQDSVAAVSYAVRPKPTQSTKLTVLHLRQSKVTRM